MDDELGCWCASGGEASKRRQQAVSIDSSGFVETSGVGRKPQTRPLGSPRQRAGKLGARQRDRRPSSRPRHANRSDSELLRNFEHHPGHRGPQVEMLVCVDVTVNRRHHGFSLCDELAPHIVEVDPTRSHPAHEDMPPRGESSAPIDERGYLSRFEERGILADSGEMNTDADVGGLIEQ
jgi:hypothetical protein